MAKIPSAEMAVNTDADRNKMNCNRTGELGRSNSKCFQFLATPNKWSGIVPNTSVVEDEGLERRS